MNTIKATALAGIVSKINGKYLDELCGKAAPGEENSQVASRRIPADGGGRCKNSGGFGEITGCPCYAGVLGGKPSVPSDLEESIVLRDSASQTEGKVAVVATIDDSTEKAEKDLPVVLAVGINYGQMGTSNYLTAPIRLWDDTDMRPRLNQAVALVESSTEKNCPHPDFPSEYHLVATNVFPWITQQPWSCYEFNSIKEMLFIQCCGFANPFAHIKEICEKLGGSLQGVVFHGASNAVPHMGAGFLSNHAKAIWGVGCFPDIIFCDNLGGSPSGIRNAIRLCGRRPNRPETPDDCDS